MSFDPNDTQNVFATKSQAHRNRFLEEGPFWRGFADNPTDDYLTGKMLFACMMRISGMRRLESLLAEPDAKTYAINRRQKLEIPEKPFHDALEATATHQLGPAYKGVKIPRTPRIKLDSLITRREGSLAQEEKMLEFIADRASNGLDIGKPRSESLWLAHQNQQMLLGLFTSMVLYSAQQRGGDIRTVPLLEPKSITLDPKVIYPFVVSASRARINFVD